MSSAILYLAIIAIWAGVLIPRWLKRDTSQASKSSHETIGDPPADADHNAQADGVNEDMTGDTDTGLAGTDTGQTGLAGPGTQAGQAGQAGPAGPAGQADGGRDDAAGYEVVEPTPAGGPDTRERILAARRRMLIILCTLTVAALGIVVIKMAAWWVAVPPIIMLGGYLMLLREASRADAERALLEAAAERDEARRVEMEQREAEQAAAEQAAQRAAERAAATARIIDISERVRDELYDQYADGERRAVGD